MKKENKILATAVILFLIFLSLLFFMPDSTSSGFGKLN